MNIYERFMNERKYFHSIQIQAMLDRSPVNLMFINIKQVTFCRGDALLINSTKK